MPTRNKLYFASDFHLGTPSYVASRERESMMVMWLDMIKADAAEVFLMGDVFDFWFEYQTVVPKGYLRFFGKLAEMADSGIKIYFFKGNHDMWMFDYFIKELNASELMMKPRKEINDVKSRYFTFIPATECNGYLITGYMASGVKLAAI